jgi:ribulose-phosphate 3-epimerase
LNPGTPVHLIEEVLDHVDLILIMSVNPGFGGQKFLRRALKKIREAAKLSKNARRPIEVEVDGGIDEFTAASVVESGATVLVAGTAVFKQPDIGAAISSLRRQSLSKAPK